MPEGLFIGNARRQNWWTAVKVRARGCPANKIALAAEKVRLERLFAPPDPLTVPA
jgi:hypothetical protein